MTCIYEMMGDFINERKRILWAETFYIKQASAVHFCLQCMIFFKCTYHRHLTRTGKYVRLMIFLCQKVFLKTKNRFYVYFLHFSSVQFSHSVMSDSATQWTAARQASLSITNSRSPPKPMSIELVMPSNHLILCRPRLLLPSIFPSIRVFSNESALRIRWTKYWSFSFSISPSNEHPGLISFRMDWLDLWMDWLQSKGLSRVFSNTTVQKHQFFGIQLSSQSNSHIHTWPLEKP